MFSSSGEGEGVFQKGVVKILRYAFIVFVLEAFDDILFLFPGPFRFSLLWFNVLACTFGEFCSRCCYTSVVNFGIGRGDRCRDVRIAGL